MGKGKGKLVELTELEAEAVAAWLEEVAFGEPDKTLVDLDWEFEDIDSVKDSLAHKLGVRW